MPLLPMNELGRTTDSAPFFLISFSVKVRLITLPKKWNHEY